MISASGFAIVLSSPVHHLHDGDTFHVQGERVRLAINDSPEIDQSCKGPDGAAYDCGDAAREAIIHLIAGRRARCAGKDIDRYGRPVVTCTADGDAISLNEQMVMRGQAVADYFGRNVSPYQRGEDMARRTELGIWSGPFEEPGDWRREHRR